MKQKIIPPIGLGTWKLNGSECEKVVHQALELGYRHIDTADVYQNHEPIGKAIEGWPRKEIFLATKLYLNDLLPLRVKSTAERFLEELRVDYIDLLLIHWPNPNVNLADTLQAMLSLKEKGIVKHIGVSNFVREHLKFLAPYKFPIVTNQIELHPYLQRKALVAACKAGNIEVTAYRPLAKGSFEKDSVMQKIGKKYGKTPSQIALKWLLHQDYSIIPKAASLKHLKENLNLFDFNITPEDMQEIDKLDSGQRFCAPDIVPSYED